ncbi:hypothetical protein DAEQUDRAFT_294098 [Daedalea quercina L-15889]|uniref:G domain-containing protein n=1 Tax=Daedalea quercina L-15889 TaxID=1314783 RepID=A0A165U088_9APHY|nr:hypothetical protein DAEQUDRAFT_294098 [Daedalea quercina L-15889]
MRRPKQPPRNLSPPRRKSSPLDTLLRRNNGSPLAYVLVMGSTGTGKSTLINLVSGSHMRVGSGLQSETAAVELSKVFKYKSQRVIMVDTPGFDDTSKSDSDVLAIIATYLAQLRRKGVRIRGVVYLHRITDNRMGGTALRNFRMFEAICGDCGMNNAVIVLNMWDRAKSEVYEAREKELRESELFFKPAVTAGAYMMRHDGSAQSAEAILHYLVSKTSAYLQIQTEMIDDMKAIHMTKAGLALLGDLTSKEFQHIEELRRVREEREDARSRKDLSDEEELDNAEKRLESLRRKLAEEQQRLRQALIQQAEQEDTAVPRPGRFQAVFGFFMSLIAPRRLEATQGIICNS